MGDTKNNMDFEIRFPTSKEAKFVSMKDLDNAIYVLYKEPSGAKGLIKYSDILKYNIKMEVTTWKSKIRKQLVLNTNINTLKIRLI